MQQIVKFDLLKTNHASLDNYYILCVYSIKQSVKKSKEASFEIIFNKLFLIHTLHAQMFIQNQIKYFDELTTCWRTSGNINKTLIIVNDEMT